MHFAPNLGWTDVQFVDLLADALELPVVVGNDADLGVLAEHLYGAAVGASEVAYVGGTVGIGGGFLVRGQPLRGVEGYAGEVGHLMVDSDGSLCRCGSRGCWETKIGANRLLSSAGRLTGGGRAAVEEVVLAATNGDRKAGAPSTTRRTGWASGSARWPGCSTPRSIVLGGDLGQVLDARTDRVLETLHERDGIDFAQSVSVRSGALGSDAPLLGAAEVAFGPLLRDPVSCDDGLPQRSRRDLVAGGGARQRRLTTRQPRRGVTLIGVRHDRRRASTAMAVLGVVAALGLGSCSSSDDSGASAPTGSAAATASCQVDDVPEGGALLPTESSRGLTRGAVGILLAGPGRVPASTRRQGPLLVQALARLGLHPRVEHVDADRTAPVPLTRTLIADGVRVIVLGPVGRAAGVRVEKVAGLAGVPVIEYGGVNFGGSAPYLVSTDYEDVGRLQAQLLVGCLKARGLTDPSIILVDGGTDVDENAVLMAIGAHQVLDPMVAAGKVDVQQETVVKGWDLARAAPVFSQALDASHGRVDGVLAGDDDIAHVVTDVLRQRGLGGTVVVGQGSGTQGLRRVLTGQQSATVVTDPHACRRLGRATRRRAGRRHGTHRRTGAADHVHRPAPAEPAAAGAARPRAGGHPGHPRRRCAERRGHGSGPVPRPQQSVLRARREVAPSRDSASRRSGAR